MQVHKVAVMLISLIGSSASLAPASATPPNACAVEAADFADEYAARGTTAWTNYYNFSMQHLCHEVIPPPPPPANPDCRLENPLCG